MYNILREIFNVDSIYELSILLNEIPDIERSILGNEIYYFYKKNDLLLNSDESGVTQIRISVSPNNKTLFSINLPPEIDLIRSLKYNELIMFLGEPSDFGGGNIDPALGKINFWVKYVLEKYYLHLEFSNFYTISNITFIAVGK